MRKCEIYTNKCEIYTSKCEIYTRYIMCKKKKYLFSHLLNFGKVTQATLASYTNSYTTHKSRESVRSLPVLLTLSPTTTLHSKTKVRVGVRFRVRRELEKVEN